MLDIGTCIRHYKRKDVQDEIILGSQNKEVAPRYGDGFGQRPDILKYPKDILEFAQKGATSFHASEELWNFPLRLGPQMAKEDLDELRMGWDLVLDIDCAFVEYSKVAAVEIVKRLKEHNVQSISCKFSGNKGFHIGVPFESFPRTRGADRTETKLLFPEAARVIAAYLKDQIKDNVRNRILEMENNNLSKIIEKTGKQPSADQQIKIGNDKGWDTWKKAEKRFSDYFESFLNIDTVLISNRHLYRIEYSLHEKSGLVSLPLNPNKVSEFEKSMAKPDSISISEHKFLSRKNTGDASELFDSAFAHKISTAKPEPIKRTYIPASVSEGAIPVDYFPPCIKKILDGMQDGRKRGLFVLLNFLSNVGWDYKDVENTIIDWNTRNKPPLGEQYISGQISYHRQKKEKTLPPNCSNPGYYSDMQVKCPESICSRYKNPAAFPKRKK